MGTQYFFSFLFHFKFTKQFHFVTSLPFILISGSVIQIILCSKVDKNVELLSSLTELLEQHGIEPDTLGEPFVVDVAKHPPMTREQFNQASACWPVNFHEDK